MRFLLFLTAAFTCLGTWGALHRYTTAEIHRLVRVDGEGNVWDARERTCVDTVSAFFRNRDQGELLGGQSEWLVSPAADDDSPRQAAPSSGREPLFPSDEHLRRHMQRILDAAAAELRDVLQDQPQPASTSRERRHPVSEEAHWAFLPLRQVSIPNEPFAWHPIDRFIRQRLKDTGLAPNPPAPVVTRMRRLSYDLRGLPPNAETIEAWQHRLEEGPEAPQAWAELVDNYLQDPAFGEHWARLWLDLARYADSDGYELDEFRPHAYPYRDFVIWAFNHDLPYDRFVQWQIAGDELLPDFAPAVAATGFLAAAPHNTFMPQPVERYDELHDQIDTIGQALLGLSIGCARCHDHFYDPISIEDYYGLVAVFESATRTTRFLRAEQSAPDYAALAQPLIDAEEALHELQVARIRADKIARLDFTPQEKELLLQPVDPHNLRQQELLARCGGCLRADAADFEPDLRPLPEHEDQWAELTPRIANLKATLPMAPPQVLSIQGSEARPTTLQRGGKLENGDTLLGPQFLPILLPADAHGSGGWRRWLPPVWQSAASHPRTAMAYWITDVESGAGALVARVIVNRLWQQYFGTGFVSDSNDFGFRSAVPSHPDLLEWLAGELVRSGWSLKHLHRLIVTSETYQQSSRLQPEHLVQDPCNQWFSRYPIKRLSAEMYRDSVLWVTGNLNSEMYGPSIFPPIPLEAIYTDDYELDAKWPTDVEEGPAVWRRSIYIALRRSNTVPLLTLLDAPDGGKCRGRRIPTTTPVQMLALMNSPFLVDQAARMAEQLSETSLDLEVQIQTMYRRMFQRRASDEELSLLYGTIVQRRQQEDVYDSEVLAEICHALMISNEFLYID
ncbi:MAG: hypothetical protein KatS3mg111_2534 [Pirellulaceae bacterium]|nr:MAG: hypothetical protein KatS3mg111_2534 [Pirellulaceae bacterium]